MAVLVGPSKTRVALSGLSDAAAHELWAAFPRLWRLLSTATLIVHLAFLFQAFTWPWILAAPGFVAGVFHSVACYISCRPCEPRWRRVVSMCTVLAWGCRGLVRVRLCAHGLPRVLQLNSFSAAFHSPTPSWASAFQQLMGRSRSLTMAQPMWQKPSPTALSR